MKSPYLSELQPNQTVHGTFLVSYKDVRQKKSGEPYLSLTLTDRTGDLDAKMWDNAADSLNTFERDDFVRIKGLFQIFQNRPQLTLHKIQPVPESEIDLADYLPASKRDRDEMFRELQGWIAGMSDPHLKGLLQSMFADEEIAQAFRTAPAAKTVHHNWIGGLIEHVLSLCNLAKASTANYPHIDFDLLLTGVLLHDIGKIRELHYARSFGYTTEGQLLGHIQIGVQMVLDKLRLMPEFPPRLRELVIHMILSHHGELEFGSPKIPLFPEALLLHLLDNMDSKMECMRALIDRDQQIQGVWTGYNSALDRSALKKRKYLDAAPEPAVETPAAKESPQAPEPGSLFADKLRGALGSNS
ncbi:MAG: metal dependent phosphohydrolase [Bryobacterales bacterium]|nr:metal dependent phosphohydrolase [Bryobacterales bacterium]